MLNLVIYRNRIDSGEAIVIRSIYDWCDNQGITYKTKFMYRKDFSLKANLWNFYTYMRGKLERDKLNFLILFF